MLRDIGSEGQGHPLAAGAMRPKRMKTLKGCAVTAETTSDAHREDTLQALLARLAASRFSWFSSVRPDGRPHSVPIWHVMDQGCIYVATPSRSVKVANVRSNANVAVAAYLDDPEAGLIVEGLARLRPELRGSVSTVFEQKYEWKLNEDEEHDALIEVTPVRLLAWGQYGEGRWSEAEIRRVARGGS
jgi:general stress protein 26